MKLALFKKNIIFLLLLPTIIIIYRTGIWYTMTLFTVENASSLLRMTNPNMNTQNYKLNMKYILLWTSAKTEPFVFLGQGQTLFTDRNCPHVNCFITSNKSYLSDYTNFNVIAFHGPELSRMPKLKLPKNRSVEQRYVFASLESSDNYPICSNTFDGFFNWTWTYKLDSDVVWGYIKIKDNNKKTIGPRIEMDWMKLDDMDPVSEEFKEQLKSKTKAAAWFVSNCKSLSKRKQYVRSLQNELNKFNLSVDIYGKCGSLQCSSDKKSKCDELIKQQYYFYLAFENSFSEDYVTEKLLRALHFNAVPIVYGAANYSRFMPDGIYLNARELNVKALARKMYTLIQSPAEYANYFKWKNHYSYHDTVNGIEADEYCTFCSILNNVIKMKTTTIYNNFKQWWNPPHRCKG